MAGNNQRQSNVKRQKLGMNNCTLQEFRSLSQTLLMLSDHFVRVPSNVLIFLACDTNVQHERNLYTANLANITILKQI